MLNLIFLVFSAIGTVGAVYHFEDLSHWWGLAIFPGLFLSFTLFWALVILGFSLILHKKKTNRVLASVTRWMIGWSNNWMMGLINVHVKVSGKKLLPKEPFVLVSNHRSGFDPLAYVSAVHRRKMIFITKESNLDIPIFGHYIYHGEFLAIDRENPMRAMRTVKKAAEMMTERKFSVGIYPEGTRSKTAELLEFKAGAFLLAKKAKAPVVVMSTWGTDGLMKRKPFFKRAVVHLDILDVIDKETVMEKSIEEISMIAREKIGAALQKFGGENVSSKQ